MSFPHCQAGGWYPHDTFEQVVDDLARRRNGAPNALMAVHLVSLGVSCYVDTVRSYPAAGLRFTEFCHLLADDRDELHALADRLGMPRRSFQDHPWRWHYDLPSHLRPDAVRFGAIEIEIRAVGRLLRDRRDAATAAGAGGA